MLQSIMTYIKHPPSPQLNSKFQVFLSRILKQVILNIPRGASDSTFCTCCFAPLIDCCWGKRGITQLLNTYLLQIDGDMADPYVTVFPTPGSMCEWRADITCAHSNNLTKLITNNLFVSGHLPQWR